MTTAQLTAKTRCEKSPAIRVTPSDFAPIPAPYVLPQIAFTRVSRNAKTGPIPVTTTSEETCAESCPLKRHGCYAESGPLALFWRKVTERKAGLSWEAAMREIRKLPKGTLWRHNQAGDLPGIGDSIDKDSMESLIAANRGKRGFTYTHKPVTPGSENAYLVAKANLAGFAVNLSADNLVEADSLAALDIAPVVVVLPADQTRATKTPSGRHVAICPATISDNVNCASCGLCAEIGARQLSAFLPMALASARQAQLRKGIEQWQSPISKPAPWPMPCAMKLKRAP